MKKVGYLISRNDVYIGFEKFGCNPNQVNLCCITGLVGSGKSTLANELSKKYDAIILRQDILGWSDCYTDDLSKHIINLFLSKFPETEDYFTKKLWREIGAIDKELKLFYNIEFEKLLIEYARMHTDKLFIIEGINIFSHYKSTNEIYKGLPFVIKRTSALKSLIRRIKRDKPTELGERGKTKSQFYSMVFDQAKIYHLKHVKLLNKCLEGLIKGER